jgi:hypothetical protein
MSRSSFWGSKVRQFRAHVRAVVGPAERDALATWLGPAQLALFDSMHVADQRHGLDVVATLRDEGVTDLDLLTAGLLHDAGKESTGVVPRIVHSLGERYGEWIPRTAAVLPGMRSDLVRLRVHAESSARLAAAAGCGPRTIELIRYQDAPQDPEFGELLKLADEAN